MHYELVGGKCLSFIVYIELEIRMSISHYRHVIAHIQNSDS